MPLLLCKMMPLASRHSLSDCGNAAVSWRRPVAFDCAPLGNAPISFLIFRFARDIMAVEPRYDILIKRRKYEADFIIHPRIDADIFIGVV